MIVTIADAIFASDSEPLALLAVLQLGEAGRHLVHTDPVFDPRGQHAVNAWLKRQAPEIGERVTFTLEQGIRADSGTRHDVEIRIESVPEPRYDRPVPQLPLVNALALMQRPLVILVEDRRTDGAFLRRVITGRWRRVFKQALDAAWVNIENGGGLGNMTHRVTGAASDPPDRLRLWVLFDSDAREPGVPSTPSEALRMHCVGHRIAHHQLKRRTMENYLPVPVLIRSSARLKGAAKTRRRKTAQAFQDMSATQRHCYNMKNGFRGDRGRDGSSPLPAHFANHATHPDLQYGFGKYIGELFSEGSALFEQQWLVQDGQTDETNLMVQAVIRRL